MESRKAFLQRYGQELKKHLGRIELILLLMTGLIMGGLWAFMELTDAVLEGEAHQFDTALLLMMRNPADLSDPVGPHWLEELGRDYTALGGIGILVLLMLAALCYLLLVKRRRAALLVLATVGSGLLLSTLLKLGFDRPRPDLVPHASYVYSASFPSGHSMMSAVTYLTLGALLARIHARQVVKVYFLTLAVLLTVAVGISRVYLGVHWPTDVLAGWTAGAVWALFCWLVALWLQHRGTVERDAHASA